MSAALGRSWHARPTRATRSFAASHGARVVGAEDPAGAAHRTLLGALLFAVLLLLCAPGTQATPGAHCIDGNCAHGAICARTASALPARLAPEPHTPAIIANTPTLRFTAVSRLVAALPAPADAPPRAPLYLLTARLRR